MATTLTVGRPPPRLLRAVAMFDIVTAGLPLLVASCAITLAVSGVRGTTLPSERALLVGIAAVFGLVAAAMLLVAVGLLRLWPWAHTARIALACLGLMLVPLGTIVSVAVLAYLLQPGIRVLYSRGPAARLTAQDIAAVERIENSPNGLVLAAYGCIGLVAMLVIALVVLVGMAWSSAGTARHDAVFVGPPNNEMQLTSGASQAMGAARS